MKNNAVISHRLQIAIQEKGITQRTLAKRSGVTESAISRYVHGTRIPYGTNLIRIAKSLEVSCDWLLGSNREY